MKQNHKGHILLIDDDKDLGESYCDILEAKGYQVTFEEEADCALDLIEEGKFNCVVTDFQMPLIDGMELLTRARKLKRHLPIIMMTAHSSTERAIEATRLGAFEYLVKPVEIPNLLDAVAKAVSSSHLSTRPVSIGTEEDDSEVDSIIGTSVPMMNIFKEIGRVADKPVSILIEGATGTGKKLIARSLFQNSDRSGKPFIAINCAAIPEDLIESELFGHERGAFSNAVTQRIGRFEQAHKGTLFLDEIGELPLIAQAKLLKVLEEKVIRRVGGNKEIPIDVRIICATHDTLSKLVGTGAFREDLYHRINTVRFQLPKLSERSDDISPLTYYFMGRISDEFEMETPGIHKKALQILEGEIWPGNVRELENVIRRALLKCDGRMIDSEIIKAALADTSGTVDFRDLTGEGQNGKGFSEHIYSRLLAASKDELDGRGAFETLVEEVEENLYRFAVQLSHGNQSKMSKWLGVSRLTVRDKLDKFDLFPKRSSKPKSK